MKVGVVAGKRHSVDGGRFSLQSSVISALSSVKTKHQFILIDYIEENNFIRDDGVQVIGLKSPYEKYDHEIRLFFDIQQCVFKSLRSAVAKLHPAWRFLKPESPVARLVRMHQLDVVWFIAPNDAEIVSCPIMTTVWDLEHRLHPWFPEINYKDSAWDDLEDYYQRVLPRAMRVITGTQRSKEDLVHFYRLPSANVEVVPFPVPGLVKLVDQNQIMAIRNRLKIEHDYFIYPSQFWPHKNHVNLLYALAILKSENSIVPNIVFTGADKGNKSYVDQVARSLGVEQYIKYLGFVPEDDLNLLYQGAVALVFPSFFGPDNLPPLEACARGCPVIASTSSGSQEQLGDAVISFNATRPDELAAVMQEVFSDKSLRDCLRLKGYERVAQSTPSNYVEKICTIINQIEPVVRCWRANYDLSR